MKKLTFGQVIAIISGLGGIIPLLAELWLKGVAAYQECAAAIAAPWAVVLLIISTVSGALSKSLVDTLKGK